MSDHTEAWREMSVGGVFAKLGPLLSRREGEGWRYGVRTCAVHGNPIGVVHGGFLMTLLDQIATLAAAWSIGENAMMTLQMDTRFLGPARVGDLVEGSARLRHRTRSTLFMDATLSVGGRAVADAAIIMRVVQQG